MGGEPPGGRVRLSVQKGPVPNYDKQGCYAFVSEGSGITARTSGWASRRRRNLPRPGDIARLNTYSWYVDGDY